MQTRKTGVRAQQADRTRDNILKAAVKVFSKEGFTGGRIEQISTLAKSNDRMIYYYFGSKEKLFISVLEHIYASFNQAEAKLRLDLADPEQALRELVAFIWDYYVRHPEFVTILATENLHQGLHARKSQNLRALSGEAVGVLRPIIEAGQAKGLFRDDICITHAYLMIASLCYFYNSNRHTLSSFLAVDLADKQAKAD
ncbi:MULTISPECIES: TetR family transcriptional regulator [unclassified Pseudomonas]|nr:MULTISPECIES: TetR family transcriptional regulator [unclassified Pseudomonas]MCX2816430.1 TetR family transcriptional regulator [Pseudomonas sp. DCB_E]MCX9143161.1 TetR family transcriptional regulator [Pseudomonas sp. DCB_Q]